MDMPSTKPRKPTQKRYTNGKLKADLKHELISIVVDMLHLAKTKADILKSLKEREETLQDRTAQEIFAAGEKEFMRSVGVSKPQLRHVIYSRLLQTIGDPESSSSNVTQAARQLTQMFDLKEGGESVDKQREVRLWKDYIDTCGPEELSLLQDQFDSHTFNLDGISQEMVNSRREDTKRGRK